MTTIFIPRSRDCAVHFTWDTLRSYNSSDNKKILVLGRNERPGIQEYTVMKASTRYYKEFVFAHGRPDGSGLISYNDQLIDGDWWNSAEGTKICVFHVCYGANFLSAQKNIDLYYDWLSYGQKLYMLIGDRRLLTAIIEFWRNVFIDMINVIAHTNSIAEIKQDFKKIYLKGLLELDRFKPGDLGQLTKSHIVLAMEAMRTKYS